MSKNATRQEFDISARFEFLKTGRWQEINHLATKALVESGHQVQGLTVQSFLGLSHGLLEIFLSLKRLSPAKNTIVLESGGSPRFKQLAQYLTLEGFEVIWLPSAKLSDPASWLDKIAKSLIAVFTVYDHPLFDTIEEHEALLEQATTKRFFVIRMTHAPQALKRLGRPRATEVALKPVRQEWALAVGGERYHSRPMECEFLPWDGVVMSAEDLAAPDEAAEAIAAFEDHLPYGFSPLTRPVGLRIAHRSAIYTEEFDGSALAELLAPRFGIKLSSVGAESRIESLSLLRWCDPRLDEWLAELGLSPNQRRGLIAIDSSLINADAHRALDEAAAELRALQRA